MDDLQTIPHAPPAIGDSGATPTRYRSLWPNRDPELRQLWVWHRGSIRKVAKSMGLRRGQVDGRSRVLGLQFPLKKHPKEPVPSHPAIVEGRTMFPSRVRGPDAEVLRPGHESRKLGKRITKGPWKGFPIYSLTLEERKTCPPTCSLWRACYGNHMGRAIRYDYGLPLEIQIWRSLHRLNKRYPKGFAVRTHNLGDYYSESYVDLWEAALDHFPALHVFGYTHWRKGSPIGMKIVRLREQQWDRFAVRTSGAWSGPRATVIKREEGVPPGSIVCPAQTSSALKPVTCATCALCWSPTVKNKAIVFQQH